MIFETEEELLQEIQRHRCLGRRVVTTNGCFDILHMGHVRSLRAARACGDVLLVLVNSDSSVRALKGDSRPIVSEGDRMALLDSLKCVDAVCLFSEPTPTRLLCMIQPAVHCKGADYAPPSGKPIPEREAIEAWGGRVEFLPLEAGLSTTEIVRKIRES